MFGKISRMFLVGLLILQSSHFAIGCWCSALERSFNREIVNKTQPIKDSDSQEELSKSLPILQQEVGIVPQLAHLSKKDLIIKPRFILYFNIQSISQTRKNAAERVAQVRQEYAQKERMAAQAYSKKQIHLA